jgi:pimeloyl-ACP methyl ester carboxylesterase
MRCTSRDGTQIAYTRAGDGPPIILVDGALCHRQMGPNRKLAERLSKEFTVFTYDRRGRGKSGDSSQYAATREIEDLAALIDAAAAPVHLYGISSGGMLALDAATRLAGKVATLALYEVPFIVDDSRPPAPETYATQLTGLIADGRRGAAVKLFMRDVVGLPSVLVAAMPVFPGWSKNKACAHTLAYDAAIMGDTQRGHPLPTGRWASVTVPTLVASGAKSPAWMRTAAARLAAVLPDAQHRTLDGQTHSVNAGALAPVLAEFFTAADPARRPALRPIRRQTTTTAGAFRR